MGKLLFVISKYTLDIRYSTKESVKNSVIGSYGS